MRTCKYITAEKVPNTYMTLSKSVPKGKYHGCFYIFEDGTRKLIDKKDKCWYATNDFKILTRSQKNKQAKAKVKDVVKYLSNIKSFIEQQFFSLRWTQLVVYQQVGNISQQKCIILDET